MKRIILYIMLSTAIILLIPILMAFFTPAHENTAVEKATKGPQITVKIAASNETLEMPLEEYLVGVVAAEMPAEFPMEALKAQAVAARTYALKKMYGGLNGEGPHPGAHICTDHTHCQAWKSQGERQDTWGKNTQVYQDKITAAVESTLGQVLTYKGNLIEPVYHSTSNGKTENSEDAWRSEVPYLRSVSSPWDRESPRYKSSVAYTLAEIDQRLGTTLGAVPVSSLAAGSPIGISESSPTGRARVVTVDGKKFTAAEIREKLGLASCDISWTIQNGGIKFTCKGYGHGVGMSQYGARGMALEDHDYKKILKYYYTDVNLERAY